MSDKNGKGGFLFNCFVLLFTVWTLIISSWTGIASHKFRYRLGSLMGFYGCGNELPGSVEVESSLTR
jgi:hypothetical protein